MSPGDEGRFEILCPCCAARLVVDSATGVLLSHEEPPKKPSEVTFDKALGEVRAAKEKADKEFLRKMEQSKHEKEILAKKFEEAMKKAEKNKDAPPPPRPFEFD